MFQLALFFIFGSEDAWNLLWEVQQVFNVLLAII